jgi:type VI secretion system protein ImpL
MKAIFGLFRKRWVLTLLGLILLSLLIWFIGPLFAFAEYKPLDPESRRWLLIGLVFAIWLARLAWGWIKQLRANRSLLSGLIGSGQTAQPSEGQRASAEEVSELRRRMQDALGILKKMRVKGDFGTRYVYQLPWYVIIGAPGAGKTTALLNSGLRFPLTERLGPQAVRGVGGTRNCDWWFTDDAVLLDTAGRYTTQDSDREVDKAAWLGFLELLKRHRGRRPINGALVAISLPDLVRQTPSERERHASEIRQRLQELHQSLGIRFPVYVLFTKCDLFAGFVEFFGDLNREQLAQVWGVTFPVTEDPASGKAIADFAGEFDALEKRLNSRILMRVQQERDFHRRALIYSFPQEFSATRDVASNFLSQVFETNRFEERVMLRGVYFTSGTQEGTPLDRVMTSLARTYGLQQSPLPANVATGKSYFVTRLLKAVVFGEADLAGTNLRLERQRDWLRRGAYIGIGALSLLIVLAFLVSFERNREYVAEVDRQREQAKTQLQALAWDQPGFEVVLPILGLLRSLPGGYDERDRGAPVTMRFGLYQGDKLGGEAQSAYGRALEKMLLPRIVQRLEQQLRTRGTQFESQFDTLKVYLMLNDPRHFDAGVVQAWAQRDWIERAPEIAPVQRDDLKRHTDALFESPQLTQSLALDQQLVDEVRRQLLAASPARRIYDRIKGDPRAAKVEPFTVLKAGGPDAQFILVRKSGQPLSSGIPGLFTYRGYHEVFLPGLERAIAQDIEESWVLGAKPAVGLVQSPPAMDEVRRLYFDEYISRWEALLNDVTVAPMPNLGRAVEVLNLLSRPDSPLRKFLDAASRETTLAARTIPTASAEAGDSNVVGKALDKLGKAGKGLLEKSIGLGEETPVDKRFAGLHRLVKGDDAGKAPIDSSLALLAETYSVVVAKQAVVNQGLPPPPNPADEAIMSRLEGEALRSPAPLGPILQTVAQDARATARAGAYAKINQLWTSEILAFCAQALRGRYPLARSTKQEATQADFGQFFGPGGKVEDFYRTNLQQYLGPSAAPQSNANLPISHETMVMLQNAKVIKEVFFRSGTQVPGLTFELKPLRMDARIDQFILDVDGQPVRYEHGPATVSKLTWPGPKGTGQIRIQIAPPAPSGRSAISEDGPWALLRMLDQADIKPTNLPDRFTVTFQIEGRTATFELRASSVYNPFRLQALERFQCTDRL